MKSQTACFPLPKFPCLDGIFGGSALLFRAHEDRVCHRTVVLLNRLRRTTRRQVMANAHVESRFGLLIAMLLWRKVCCFTR